jgi:hypothetical protein
MLTRPRRRPRARLQFPCRQRVYNVLSLRVRDLAGPRTIECAFQNETMNFISINAFENSVMLVNSFLSLTG